MWRMLEFWLVGRFLLVLHRLEVCLLSAAWGLISILQVKNFIFGIFTFFEEMTFWCPKDEDLRTEAWMVFQSKPGTKLKSCRWNLYILEFLHFSRLLFDSAFPTLVWIVESLQIILMLLQLPQPMMFAWMVPVRMINFYCLEEEGG